MNGRIRPPLATNMLQDSLPVPPQGEPLYLLIAASFLPLYDHQTILYKGTSRPLSALSFPVHTRHLL